MTSDTTQAVIDWRSKGLPVAGRDISRSSLAGRNWHILREDMMLPVAVLRQSALAHNADWMRRFAELTGVSVAPHGKTTMSRELFDLQMQSGAWGMTAATVGHVRIYREFGLQRILLANQLLGRQAITWVLEELRRDPDFDFYCLVDSAGSLEILEDAVAANSPPRPLQLLLELGYAGGRSGLRDDEEAMRLARRIAASPAFVLRGIEGFEGIVQGQSGDTEKVGGLLGRMERIARAADDEALFSGGRPILSAGGSSFFDLVAGTLSRPGERDRFEILLRSGCYLVHDSHFYRDLIERLHERSPAAATLGEGLRPALELWAYVHGRPEPTRLIAGLGKRDAGNDVAMPTPLGWCRPGDDSVHPLHGHNIVRMDDQHAYLDVPADSPLQPGDMMSFGISHPCTTFDKWRTLFVVDDALKVVDAVETNF